MLTRQLVKLPTQRKIRIKGNWNGNLHVGQRGADPE